MVGGWLAGELIELLSRKPAPGAWLGFGAGGGGRWLQPGLAFRRPL